jgi:outer membrane protein assembly factor BamE (lipoprotein component of BamABCDE complex)
VRIPRWLRIARIAMVVVGSTALLLVVSAWAALYYLSPMSRCDVRRFTPALWQDRAASQLPRAIRGCVVDDLMAHTPIRGRSRADIVALLGEPTKTDYFKDYDLVYWLGPERLVIRLDSLGRVSDFYLVTD